MDIIDYKHTINCVFLLKHYQDNSRMRTNTFFLYCNKRETVNILQCLDISIFFP
uniref:Uncharacterized protein n=1 Tax=Arundo donax TaxID=35708 RepID=A0A0A9EQT8_ARUDO